MSNKPVDVEILSVILARNLDLTTYRNELLHANKPEKQSNTFWFLMREFPGETEEKPTTQTASPRKILQLNEKKN